MASVRKIPIQNRSVAGRFYSHKNGKLLDFESQLEKKCFLLLEFDISVTSYIPQPLKIQRYVPDILAIRKDKKPLLIEVKYSNEADNPDDKLKKKLKALSDYCRDNDMEFLLFTDKRLVEPYFSNINLLYNYMNVDIPADVEERILSSVPDYGISVREILEKFGGDTQYLRYVYKLIAKGVVTTNLHSILSLGSIVRKSGD